MKREPKNERRGRERGRKEGNQGKGVVVGEEENSLLSFSRARFARRCLRKERKEKYNNVCVQASRQEFIPSNARAFSLTSFETQNSSCDYIRVSGRLIYSPKCLLDLNYRSGFLLSGNAITSCNVLSCWAQLVGVYFFGGMLNSFG